MEVPLAPDNEAQLLKMAAQQGLSATLIAKEVLDEFLEEARFIEAVEAGEAELAKGNYLTHEEVGIRLQKMMQSS